MEYTELVEKCKLVHTRSETDGCDCWGSYYWKTSKHVYINGKEKQVFDGMYVVHDGKSVKEVLYDFEIKRREREKEQEQRMKEHKEKTGFETPREYAAYLKGLAELENNPEFLEEKIRELRIKKLNQLKGK